MPEIRFEADADTVAVIDGYCSATGKCRTEFINLLLKQWARQKLHEASSSTARGRRQSGATGGGPEVVKQNKVRTFAALCAAVQEPAGLDRKALARTADDVALELHGFGNALHKAGLHQHGTAADVAAGMIETIVEELRDGY